MNSRVANNTRLLDNSIWNEYNKKYISKKYKFESREEFKKVIKEIFKVIAKNLIEKEAGVLLRNFGYFFIWKIPQKMKYSITERGKNVVEKYNMYTDNYMYSPQFLGGSNMSQWSMDNTFNYNIKKNLKSKLLSGKHYKMFVNTFKSLI